MSKRHALELEQVRFINQIMEPDRDQKSRYQQGLRIYRNNILATAKQALSITFPTLEAQVGDDVITNIAQLLLETYPPHKGDWAEWGEALPNLLKTVEQLNPYPFLSDVARVDLAIHQVERAKDEAVDINSFHLLAKVRLSNLVLQLNPSIQFFTCNYPVIEIQMIAFGPDKNTQNELQEKINTGKLKQNILVYRPEFKGLVRELDSMELKWLTLLAKGATINDALDEVGTENFDFSEWLATAIQEKLITRIITRRC